MKTTLAALLFAVAVTTSVFTFQNTDAPKSVGVRTAAASATNGTPGEFISVAKYGDVADDYAQAVCVDSGGNVVIGGSVTTITGSPHPFFAKRLPFGTLAWSNILSGNGLGSIQAVATDVAGNVFVTGYFMGALDMGGGASLTSTYASYNMFVAKFSSGGTHVWSKRFGTLTPLHPGLDIGNSIAVDSNDNSVVLAGSHGGDVDFGNGTMQPSSGQNLFLVKLSAVDGSYKWARGVNSTANTTGNAVAIDSTGNIFLTGGMTTFMNLNATIDFGNGPKPVTNSVMFVAKYAANGSNVWAKQFGVSAEGRTLALTGSNVVVVGRYQMSINFGGQTLTNAPGSSPLGVPPNSSFVANLSAANGGHNWSRSFGVGLGTGVSVGPNGNLSYTTAQGLIANLAADGTTRWSKQLVGQVQCSAVAIDSQGNSFVTGNLRATVDFGGGPVSSTGRADIFLLELGTPNTPPSSTPFNITLTGPHDDPDGDTNTVYFVACMTQFSNNIARLEASDYPLFPPNGTAAAEWGCYPIEQQVAAFIFTTRGSGNKFYRGFNTPCGSIVPASIARAAIGVVSPVKPVPKFIQNWRSKDRFKVGTEVPSTNPNMRLFTLVKATSKTAPPPPTLPGMPKP